MLSWQLLVNLRGASNIYVQGTLQWLSLRSLLLEMGRGARLSVVIVKKTPFAETTDLGTRYITQAIPGRKT